MSARDSSDWLSAVGNDALPLTASVSLICSGHFLFPDSCKAELSQVLIATQLIVPECTPTLPAQT